MFRVLITGKILPAIFTANFHIKTKGLGTEIQNCFPCVTGCSVMFNFNDSHVLFNKMLRRFLDVFFSRKYLCRSRDRESCLRLFSATLQVAYITTMVLHYAMLRASIFAFFGNHSAHSVRIHNETNL